MSIEEAKAKLIELQKQSKFDKMLGVCAIFTELMALHNLEPIIVGGFAVEIYSRNEYTTVDIDIVFARSDLADQYLRKLGFVKEGRHWYHERLGISIEIPSDLLKSADRDKVIKINMSDSSYVYVIGLEDIILDRLRACVHRKSTSDCEWGARLLLLHKDRIEMEYLLQRAEADLTSEMLQDWLEK